MANVLRVSRSGYYAWLIRNPSKREIENRDLLERIKKEHNASNQVYGSKKILKQINTSDKSINHKRIERIMRENGIMSKVIKKYKATTNSRHNLPVAENLLNREFKAEKPNQKMVSDITYIPTDEGWLYLAAIMDLCGQKIVGFSMNSRMTKELVCNALEDVIGRTGKQHINCILHSDRGSQYCSNMYQEKIKKNGFICSMSRKGNCWDNAPMESFWGKLKQEWLNEQHFKTRDEAKTAIFEYIWIFYNRKRIHETNGYLTPEAYYRAA